MSVHFCMSHHNHHSQTPPPHFVPITLAPIPDQRRSKLPQNLPSRPSRGLKSSSRTPPNLLNNLGDNLLRDGAFAIDIIPRPTDDEEDVLREIQDRRQRCQADEEEGYGPCYMLVLKITHLKDRQDRERENV